ncbi:hypothetical protein MKX01_007989 [Papaver californicum]|nr:hypothetical protein MKX01_007989 [Papaver californicum]
MKGYEDLDEYEDDGFIEYEEEQIDEGKEEKVKEEVWKPTKDEMDFLRVRQQIKETMRRKMNKGNDSATGNSQESEKRNYGSFFGPSQPAIARRVIQESKLLLENLHLAARVLNPHHSLQSQKSPAPAKATSKPGVGEQPLKVLSMEKQKARILKDARDYSFLFSEDAELPAPAQVLPPRTSSVPNSDAPSAQLTSKIPKSVSNTSRPVLNNGLEQIPPVSVGHRTQSKQGQHKPTPDGRLNSTSVNHGKQLGGSTGKGSSRTQGTKGLLPKTSLQKKPSTLNKTSIPDKSLPHTNMDRNVSLVVGKRPTFDVQKTVLPRPLPSVSGLQKPLLKSQPSMSGLQKPVLKPQPSSSSMQRAPSKSHPHEQGKDVREPDRSRQMPKQPLLKSHASMSGLQKPLLKPQPYSSSMQRAPSKSHPHEQGKDVRDPDRSRKMPKQPVPCPTAPTVKTPKQLPSHPPAPKDRRRKRSTSPDPVNYRQMIRNMFRYNPGKYGDDKDDSSMEVGFKDIMREEMRSSRIAHEEDERERILIEKEEIREANMRKKRKLSSQQ